MAERVGVREITSAEDNRLLRILRRLYEPVGFMPRQSWLGRCATISCMSSSRMRRLGASAADIAWLAARADRDLHSGFDAGGWASSVWILHAMYELPISGVVPSFDELRQRRLEQGLEEPLIVGSVNLDQETVATGVPLGLTGRPGQKWRRLRWDQLAGRLGVSLPGNQYPPCHRWFPYRSWPANLRPPCEGSLDEETLARLLDVLAAYSPDGPQTRCLAYYSPLACGDFDAVTMFEGPLADIPTVMDPAQGRHGSPSNIWPQDRSWLVYTDWDLWATRLSGSSVLVDAAIADRELETVRWSRPTE